VVNKTTIAGKILKVANQTKLEKYHRVYTLLPALAIVGLGQGIEKIQVKAILEPLIEILFVIFSRV
jgi:hypothetical protein